MGFFDKLFGKKDDKKKQEEKKQPKQEPQQQQQKPVQQPNLKASVQNTQASQDNRKQNRRQEEDNQWQYELVLQYIASPVWKVTISEFLDEHCIVFDDEEENKFVYFDLHKKFKKMMEELVDGMLNEIGIQEEQFEEVLTKGLKSQSHRKYFEQLLVIDNFLVFKKMMIKRNKENELEALKELQKQDALRRGINVNQYGGQDVGQMPQNPDLKRLEKEKEKADMEHALALSKAVDQERKKLLQDEEDQFQAILRQSEEEYRQSQLLQRQKEEEDERRAILESQQLGQQQPRQMGPQKQKVVQPGKQPEYDYPTNTAISKVLEQKEQVIVVDHQEEEQVVVFDEEQSNKNINKYPSLQQFYGSSEAKVEPKAVDQIPQEIQIKRQSTQKLSSLEQSNKLPPIISEQSKQQAFPDFSKDSSQAEQDKKIQQDQIEKLKQQQIQEQNQAQGESVEDRKKRLMEQREVLRKKKQAENEKQIKEYQEQQSIKSSSNQKPSEPKQEVDTFIQQQKAADSEMQRKKELLEAKKKQLLMNKIKEDVNYNQDLL